MKLRKRMKRCLAVLLCAGMLGAGGVLSTPAVPVMKAQAAFAKRTLYQMLVASPSIVVAKHDGATEVAVEESDSRIDKSYIGFRHYAFEVKEVLKQDGATMAGERIFVRQARDHMNIVVDASGDDPRIVQQDEMAVHKGTYLLFLRKADRSDAHYTGGDYYVTTTHPADSMLASVSDASDVFLSGNLLDTVEEGTIKEGPKELTLQRVKKDIADLGMHLEKPEQFSDVTQQDWFYTPVMQLLRNNVVRGYPDGSFRPNQEITREEAVQLAFPIAGISISDPASIEERFADVSKDRRSGPVIYGMLSYKLIAGKGDGRFDPEAFMTREEAAVFAMNVLKRFEVAFMDLAVPPFADDEEISDWAHGDISVLHANRYVSGYRDNRFLPKKSITRAEFASLMEKVKSIIDRTRNG